MALVSGSLLLSGVDPENPKGAPGSKYMSGCEAAAVPTHTMKTIFGHVLLKGRKHSCSILQLYSPKIYCRFCFTVA